MTDTTPALTRFLARNHPGPGLARQVREDNAKWRAGMNRLQFLLEQSRARCAAALTKENSDVG